MRTNETCWPHFPGVIARVEVRDESNYHYEATIFGVTEYFTAHAHAVAWCVEMKDHARALEALRAEREYRLDRNLLSTLTIADELS